MQIKFFSIPVQNEAQANSELNSFLASHRVLSVERQLVQDGQQSFWAVCVTYGDQTSAPAERATSKKPRVDYQEVLSPEDFAVYAKLRDLRRDLAAQAGAPVYALFTNEQLAAMVTGRVDSLTAMEKIEGVGKARVEKFGGNFLTVLVQELAKPTDDKQPDA